MDQVYHEPCYGGMGPTDVHYGCHITSSDNSCLSFFLSCHGKSTSCTSKTGKLTLYFSAMCVSRLSSARWLQAQPQQEDITNHFHQVSQITNYSLNLRILYRYSYFVRFLVELKIPTEAAAAQTCLCASERIRKQRS